MTSTALAIVGLGILVFLAHLFAVLFRHLRIPDVLPLMLIGLLIGPILKIVPLEAFGRVGTVLTTITLVVILFDGGLGLDFRTLGEGTLTGTRLTFVNFVATLSVVAAVGFVLFGLALNESLMLGAILGGTSSAVVIPLVARLHLESKTRTALLLESAFSDVLCIVVTFGLLQAAKAQAVKPLSVGLQIVASFLLAGAIGAAFALLWSALLRRVRQLENSLLLTPAFVMIVYGLTELAGYSGEISSLA
ncbi:MAG: cation:proton antiporter, partial [candidate division WOR-3 bacterium]